MATESKISLRGFARIAFALLLLNFCVFQGAGAATNLSVVATGPIGPVASHPATWGQQWETAISSKGDVVTEDFQNGGVYLFPAGGGAVVTLVAGGSCGYCNSGVAFDPWDNLWIGQNWNNELERVPYANGTWNMSDPNIITYGYSWSGNSQAFNTVNASISWFQPSVFSFSSAITNASNGTATMAVSDGGNSAIYSFAVDINGNVLSGTDVVSSIISKAQTIAVDNSGNIYFEEGGGTPGVLFAPAGTVNAKDTKLTRVDPNLKSPDGVTVDNNGNLYVSDSATGVYVVPNLNGSVSPADAVLMAAVPSTANVDFDLLRGILYVPVTSGSSGGWTAPGGAVYQDLVEVALGNVNLATAPAYVPSAPETIDFGFTSSETPASFEIVEPGAATPDFAIVSGGTCTAGTTYAAGSSCSVNVALVAHTLGNVSATLEMLDAHGNILASVSLSGMGVAPSVATGPVTGVQTHAANFGQVWETAISTNGDLVIDDFEHAALYEFPGGGGPMITLAAPGNSGPGGAWANMGVAIDPWNNLWIGQNWNSDLMRVPYDPVNHTWNLTNASNLVYTSGNLGANPNWFQAGALAISSNVTNGTATMVVSAENVPALYSYSIDVNGNFTNGATVVNSLKGRAKTLAIDTTGNIYLFEDGGATGVLRVPAGETNLASDAGLVRVDPNLSNPAGVAVDAAGNVYVGDNKDGVYLVPNQNGTPNPSDAYLLAAVPAFANVDFDLKRGILYVPTTNGESGGWNGINDVAAVALGNVNLGTGASGSQGTAATVNFGLAAGVTPASIAIQEAGAATPDFAIASGGSCATGTTYAAQSTCSVNVTLSPHAAGGVSGKLLLLDAENDILGSMILYGTSQAAAVSVTPALESAIGTGLHTPSEVAADAAGNSYVADAGLKQVLLYKSGSTATTAGVSVGTGLTAPTGVAVDGAGDVFIADSGNVYELPNTPGGLNATAQITVKTGLGMKLNLATDGPGNLYIADPANARVVKLSNPGQQFGPLTQTETDLTGFTAPSVVAVDSSNNLYVVDSQKLIEVPVGGAQTTLLPSLGAATGLAIDPSGAVYASLSGGTVRIPSVSGVLSPSTETTIASSVTNPTGLALDKTGNVYLADAGAENLHLVSTNVGAINVGSPALGASASATATLLNVGNSPLTVTGYLSSDAIDFSATGCTSAVAAGSNCTATITINPMGPGVQGPISSAITVQSNAADAPVIVDASGTAAALAASKPTISVGSGATVLNIPVTITVAAASGSGATPTGSVVLSVDGTAAPAAALTKGTITVTLAGLTAASHTFSVQYVGDRVYGSSTVSTTAVVGKAGPQVAAPTLANPTYVLFLGNANGTYIPYDGSLQPYYTNYKVTVQGAPGLVPTGTVSFMQGSTAQCGPNGPPTNNLPAGSFTLDSKGTATFQPGCMEITDVSNVPNEETPQTITSIVYSGDANYAPATITTTSGGGSISFILLRQPSVSLTPNPGSLSVPAATYPATSTASMTLTVTSVLGYGVSTNPAYPSSTPTLILNNYTLPVAFNCAGLPAHSTCTFTGGNYVDLNGVQHPDQVLVNTDPSKPSTITVTVTTNVSAGTTTSQSSHSAPFEYAAVFGLGMVGLFFSRKKVAKKGYLVLICFLALGTSIAGLTACSTSQLGSAAVLGTPPVSGTPYAVTVTAQQVGSITVPGSQGPITLYGSTNQMSLPYTLNLTVQ
jgi:sugar lactone lactonase YvrE